MQGLKGQEIWVVFCIFVLFLPLSERHLKIGQTTGSANTRINLLVTKFDLSSAQTTMH